MKVANILLVIVSVLCLPGIRTKKKTFPVQVIIPQEYAEAYEQTHASLGADLRRIAASVESAFNNSSYAKHNGYEISFMLFTPPDHPLIPKMNTSICEGAVTNITSLLNDINNLDNTHHFIALLPCIPNNYAEVFSSVGVDVPIIESRINIECAKRIGMFLEKTYFHLMASFGNALMRIIDAPLNDYSSLTENNTGDDGVKENININEPTVYSILHSQCFLNNG